MIERAPVSLEHQYAWQDGHLRWLEMRAYPTDDGSLAVFWRDVTDRREAVEALRESEQRFRTLAEQIEVGVAMADRKGKMIWANDRLGEIFGLSPDALMQLTIRGITHPDDWPANERLFHRMIDDGTPFVIEKRIDSVGKGHRWYRLSVSPRRDAAERIVGGIAVVFDITDRKRAETLLHESEERQRFLLELSDALRPLSNANAIRSTACRMLGKQLGASRAYYVLYDPAGGYGEVADDYLTDGLPSLAGRYPFEMFRATYERIGDGKTWVVTDVGKASELPAAERDFYAAQGVLAWIDVPIAKDGALEAALCIVQAEPRSWSTSAVRLAEETADRLWAAVERARAEAALQESEERFRSLFETMGQAYVLLDIVRDTGGAATDVRILELNPAYGRLMNTSVQEARGRCVYQLFPDVDRWWLETCDRVARAGRPERVENQYNNGGTWFECWLYPRGGNRIEALFEEITERKRAEAALRENEERQAFLLTLSDALRPLSDPAAIQAAAMKLVAERLGVIRALLFEVDPDQDGITKTGSFEVYEEKLPTHMRLSDFGDDLAARYRMGRTTWAEDTQVTGGPEPQRKAFRNIDALAWIAVPLVKEGRLVALQGVHNRTPRVWTAVEIQLLEEVAERTWASAERARAEKALRESEERFRQFAHASAAGLWIRDAETRTMEFVSPAVATIYGVEPDALLGDIRHWASMIVPEDRASALEHIEAARRGETVVHEFRIQRAVDGAFRWIRNTDFPLDDDGVVHRIGGIAEDVTEAKLAVEHQGVLLAELQHRVRNIMAMIRSMANRGGDGSATVREYRDLLSGRLLALARVQTILTRQANKGGSLRDVVESEIAAQAHHAGQYELTGPDVVLSPKVLEVLTLAFHELSTNALKYGALSVPGGRVTVTWAAFEKRGAPWLTLDWVETGTPPRDAPTRRGFGTELIEGKIPYELGGIGKMSFEAGGARCHFELPLRDGESVLETDAPAATLERFSGGLNRLV